MSRLLFQKHYTCTEILKWWCETYEITFNNDAQLLLTNGTLILGRANCFMQQTSKYK